MFRAVRLVVDTLAQRTRAQELRGANFDIRQFRDAMLLPGSIPLELLEHIYV